MMKQCPLRSTRLGGCPRKGKEPLRCATGFAAWLLWGLPLTLALWQNMDFLETPRLNHQRAPFLTSFFVAPAQTYAFELEATEENLFALELFMRPESLVSALDDYTLKITSLNTGEERGPFAFSAWSLWDDVALIRFEPFNNAIGDSFQIVLATDRDNRASVQLATWIEDSAVPIHQPYYDHSTSLGAALHLLWQRLSWRWLFYVMLLPALVLMSSSFLRKQ